MQTRHRRLLLRLDAKMRRAVRSASDLAFEGPHYKRVQRYAVQLAALRGIDPYEALVAAMLHDSGRLLCGVSGRDHATAGAARAERLLKSSGASRSTTGRIVKAIAAHSRKKQVTSPLDEVLKDADALAHLADFGGASLPWQEQLRCQLAFTRVTQPVLELSEGLEGALISALAVLRPELEYFMAAMSASELSSANPHYGVVELVHHARNVLRQLDTVLWVIKQQPSQDPQLTTISNAIKPKAKALFRALGPLRDNHVNARKLQALQREAQKALTAQPEITEQILLSSCQSLLEALNSVVLNNPQQWEQNNPESSLLSLDITALLAPHRAVLEAATKKEIASLHRLRIEGKRLRVLKKLGWLQMDVGLSEALDDYHKQVGDLLDTERLLRLLSTQHMLEPSVIEGVMDQLTCARDQAAQKTERALLALRLQCRSIYSAR